MSIWSSLPPCDDAETWVDVATAKSWTTDIRLTVCDDEGDAALYLTPAQALALAEKLTRAAEKPPNG